MSFEHDFDGEDDTTTWREQQHKLFGKKKGTKKEEKKLMILVGTFLALERNLCKAEMEFSNFHFQCEETVHGSYEMLRKTTELNTENEDFHFFLFLLLFFHVYHILFRTFHFLLQSSAH